MVIRCNEHIVLFYFFEFVISLIKTSEFTTTTKITTIIIIPILNSLSMAMVWKKIPEMWKYKEHQNTYHLGRKIKCPRTRTTNHHDHDEDKNHYHHHDHDENKNHYQHYQHYQHYHHHHHHLNLNHYHLDD